MTEKMKFHELANIFPLMEGEEFDALVKDIRDNGLLEAIRLHPDGSIVDGRNRYRACQEAGVGPHYKPWAGEDENLLKFIISLNLKRRHLNESQRAMVAARIANMNQGRQSNAQICAFSQTQAAEQLNVSRRAVQSAKAVQDKGTKELISAVEQGEISVSAAVKLVDLPKKEQKEAVAGGVKDVKKKGNEIKREKRLSHIKETETALPEKRYSFVYADPPWRYEHSISDSREIENQYPTMELNDICNLKISDMTTDDCILFLWATNPKLKEAVQVIEAWGFTYKTNMVWVKDKIGMGYWCRQQHEVLLVATKGNPVTPLPENRVSSVFNAKRGKHSQKPEIFYEIIEKMFPDLSKIELFARTERNGWAAWGNEVCQ